MMKDPKKRTKLETQAERLVKKEKYREAIRKYQELLTGNEQDVQIKNIIGDLYVKSGQKEKAVEEFKKIAGYYEDKGLHSKSIAIYKKINKINPDDLPSAQKLADYYKNQGFTSEAKKAYLNLANIMSKNGQNKEAIQTYEKVLELDPKDTPSRMSLAEIYQKEKMNDQAVEELNKAAESQISQNNLKEAEKVLGQAKKLKEHHPRTLANLMELLKKQNKRKEALSLLDEILKKDKNNLKALYLLGKLYFEDKDYKKAEETFSKILSLQPKEVNAKVKLGKVYIQKQKFDQAYELFEPVVEALLRKRKVEQAIGLLGLILSSKNPHLPTLEKLSSVYKLQQKTEDLVLTYKNLIKEYENKDSKERLYSVLEDLIRLRPEEEEYYSQYKKLKKELGKPEEKEERVQEKRRGEKTSSEEEKQSQINSFLEKADLYMEQGLIRNAKRILENLRLEYPDNPRINQKLAEIKDIVSEVKEEEIPEQVKRVKKRETQIMGEEKSGQQGASPEAQEDGVEEKLTSADLFAETDIIPLVSQEEGEKRYYDLEDKIEEEQEAIQATLNYQRRGDTSMVEKALHDILSEFREALEENVDKEDYESRYNLGLAFLEQELPDEAIQEFKLAAKDEKLTVESYSLISFCYRQKKEFNESVKWMEKALELALENSNQFFALKYELGTLYEDMNEKKKALKLFQEVKKWNSEYRDVGPKVKALEKTK